MNPNTEAALKYFLSKDPHEYIFHTRCEKHYFKSKHILPYKDHIQSGGDLSSIIDKIREDLYDPIKEEEAIKDMIICTAMEPEFLKYVSTKHYYQVTNYVKSTYWGRTLTYSNKYRAALNEAAVIARKEDKKEAETDRRNF